MTERRREIIFGLILLIGIPALLIGGEGAYRLVRHDYADLGFDWAAFRAAAFLETEPGEPERFSPGSHYAHIRINAHGFRGPDIALPKPDGLIRIAFLGNSKMLGASLTEEQTIAGQTIAGLRQAHPQCAFDYVVGAGPVYTAPQIRDLVVEDIGPLEPDAYVVLAVTISDILAEYESQADGSNPLLVERPALADLSLLWGRLYDAFHLSRERRNAARFDLQTVLPDARVTAMAREMLDRLAAAYGDVPVVNIAYRDSLRPGQTTERQAWSARWLLSQTRGIDADDMLRLRELIAAEQARVAREQGWMHIDPIGAMPATLDYYRDPHHFNENGTALIAESVRVALTDLLTAGDHPCMESGQR